MTDFHITAQGKASVKLQDGTFHLLHPPHDGTGYHNAQISDYDATRQFSIKPPVRLSLTAQASTSDIRGTAGFGFWNHPFAPGEMRFDVPQALWFFFASSESKMALAKDTLGHGWKAATFNAKQPRFFGLLPTAPLAMPLMNFKPAYDALWPIGQRAIGVAETVLDTNLLAEAHHYQIDWLPQRAIFRIDGEIVLDARHKIPTNALGFVAWVDNQYAIVSPKGRFGFGLVEVPHQQNILLENIRLQAITKT